MAQGGQSVGGWALGFSTFFMSNLVTPMFVAPMQYGTWGLPVDGCGVRGYGYGGVGVGGTDSPWPGAPFGNRVSPGYIVYIYKSMINHRNIWYMHGESRKSRESNRSVKCMYATDPCVSEAGRVSIAHRPPDRPTPPGPRVETRDFLNPPWNPDFTMINPTPRPHQPIIEKSTFFIWYDFWPSLGKCSNSPNPVRHRGCLNTRWMKSSVECCVHRHFRIFGGSDIRVRRWLSSRPRSSRRRRRSESRCLQSTWACHSHGDRRRLFRWSWREGGKRSCGRETWSCRGKWRQSCTGSCVQSRSPPTTKPRG